WFVAGVRLPLFALPVWVKAIGLAFPLTTSLTVLRGALLDGQTTAELLGPLAWLAGLSLALFALAAPLLRVGEAHATRTGSRQLFWRRGPRGSPPPASCPASAARERTPSLR